MRAPSPEGRRLGEGYRIEVFAEGDVGADDVVAMWAKEGALDEAEARRRAEDVALVVVAPDGDVAGVSTAWLQQNPTLRLPLWNYRTFVAREHRQGDIAFLLLHATRDHLSSRYTSGADDRAVGMVFEVQNEILKRYRNQAVWPTSRFHFFGEDERGAHHRVHYFPGARAPEPGAAPA